MIQTQDGLPWLVGGPSSGPLGATVPSVKTFLFIFLTSHRLEARNASTDGMVAPKVGGRPSGPLEATVPSVEAFLRDFFKI